VFGMINAVASRGSHETAVDTFCLFLSVFEEEASSILSLSETCRTTLGYKYDVILTVHRC